jgi:hypothetical protein
MTTARSLGLGLSVGLFAAILAIVGELLGWFNCISAWFVETVVLSVVSRRSRAVTIGSSALVAYIAIISHVIIQGQISGRWFSDDWMPVFASFFFFVALPFLFAGALDMFSLRHARANADRMKHDFD